MSLWGGSVGLARGAAGDYFTSLVRQCTGDPKDDATRLGGHGEHRPPAPGVALAAVELENPGCDVAEPDRHILWVAAFFGPGRVDRLTHAPGEQGVPAPPSGKKLLEVMTAAEQVADAAEPSVVFVDHAVSVLRAMGELRLADA